MAQRLERMDDLFKGRHIEREIIVLCVRWYLRFKLSLRDLVEMMAERGLDLAHTTIMRWVQRFVPEFEKRWNRFARAAAVAAARAPLSSSAPAAWGAPTPPAWWRSGSASSTALCAWVAASVSS